MRSNIVYISIRRFLTPLFEFGIFVPHVIGHRNFIFPHWIVNVKVEWLTMGIVADPPTLFFLCCSVSGRKFTTISVIRDNLVTQNPLARPGKAGTRCGGNLLPSRNEGVTPSTLPPITVQFPLEIQNIGCAEIWHPGTTLLITLFTRRPCSFIPWSLKRSMVSNLKVIWNIFPADIVSRTRISIWFTHVCVHI